MTTDFSRRSELICAIHAAGMKECKHHTEQLIDELKTRRRMPVVRTLMFSLDSETDIVNLYIDHLAVVVNSGTLDDLNLLRVATDISNIVPNGPAQFEAFRFVLNSIAVSIEATDGDETISRAIHAMADMFDNWSEQIYPSGR